MIYPGRKFGIALVVVGLMVLILTNIGQMLFIYLRENRSPDMTYIVERPVLIWFFWVPAMLFVHRLAILFPLSNLRQFKNFGIHLSMAFIVAPVHVMYNMGTYEVIHHNTDPISNYIQVFYYGLEMLMAVDFMLYAVIVAITQLKMNYDKSKERELKNLELEAQLADARLNVIKMQLQPHFLFNTLHSIMCLIQDDPSAARKMLDYLKLLFYKSFSSEVRQLVSLDDELELIKTYLEIERTRFSDRMNVIWEISPESRSAQVPALMLQPLVENAIKYGISNRIQSGTICLKAEVCNPILILSVEDDGPGFDLADSQVGKQGLGLKMTRERLFRLYDAYEFKVQKSELGGAKIEIRIPYSVKESPVFIREKNYENV